MSTRINASSPLNLGEEGFYHFQNSNSIRAIRVNGTELISNSNVATYDFNSHLEFTHSGYGNLRELVFIGSHLSDSDRDLIEAYMMCNAGMSASMPEGHTYINFCP